MSDHRKIEKNSTEREALDAVAARPPGSGGAVRAALQRYLATERYREKPDNEKSPKPR
ncbi:MAG: hypothetical protein ABWX84_03215 [Nocardioides sp.]